MGMKKIILSIAIVIIAIGAITVVLMKGDKNINQNIAVMPIYTTTPKTIPLCFYYEKSTSRGFYDRAWLKLNITGDNVSGEFKNLPAEKDSKVGTFTGTVGSVDKMAMARTADVWWDSMAEGMQVREQLKVIFGEGTAQAAFGEMTDRGDGVYVYKDPSKFTLGFPMSDVACSDLDDRIIVENYIRANIKNLVPEKPVLGGSWYAMNIHINPSEKTGVMGYEDGHITGKASFKYLRDGELVEINSVEKLK
jgi:hypothetical protein